ncbi:MAG: HipA domain-containing protein [Clostridia bacterium]|nr:HipA domain-containing protein [Clostridia bacterium]
MIDLTNCEEELNSYKGSEKKKKLIYNNKKYLVKFPDPIRQKNRSISYINNAFSEYIGSNIFKMVGFKTQNTILGYYQYECIKKIVCACEDFTSENEMLYEFESLALGTNLNKKIETEITDIIDVLNESKNLMDIDTIRDKFWDMFVIDFLIGNTDRHNGNWGFILNKENKKIKFAPIYDCGSCLNPLLEDSEIKELTNVELKNLALNTYSCLKEDGKKINYISFMKDGKNVDCKKAIKRVFKNIDMDEIKSFINETPEISKERKDFYNNILEMRYEIISRVYDELNRI